MWKTPAMTMRRFLIMFCLAATSASLLAQGADEEEELIGVLRSEAKLFDKAKACQRLAAIGTKRAVPALAALLGDERLGGYARFGLEPIADPAVDAALRQALGTLEGRLRVGVINSIGVRRDPKAVPALATLALSGKQGAAEALAALGRIATDEAARGDEKVARAAFKALGVLAGPKDLPALVELHVAAKGAAAQAETAVVLVAGRMADPSKRADAVLGGLASAKEAAPRAALLRVLGRIGGEKAYAAVVGAIGDNDATVRDAAIRAVAAWPDARAADALLALVKDADSEIHRVLALRGYVRLLGLAKDDDPRATVRKYAEALAMARRPDARKLILGGLAGVAHAEALALVMTQLDDPAVRPEAASAAVTIARAIMGADREAARGAMEKVLALLKSGPVAAEARQILRQIDKFADSITAWRIAEPYSQKGKRYTQLFDIAFEPEKPDAKGVEWRPLPAGTDPKRPWILDLLKAIGGQQRVAYALTWIHSETAQPARLELGSDDGVKAWLNGKLVHANNVARAAKPYTDQVNVTLKAGWNPLLLKITQNDSPWEFCARIRAANGKPLRNIRFDPAHEGEWRLSAKAAVPAKLTTLVPAGKGNAGIQVRSQRIPNNHEMIGY